MTDLSDGNIVSRIIDPNAELPKLSYWQAILARLKDIQEHPDPNLVPCTVKVLMPNPKIPDEDMVMANVVTEDRALNLLIPAANFYPLTGPRMAVYFLAIFRKDARALDILCEVPDQRW